jgi:dihydroorotase
VSNDGKTILSDEFMRQLLIDSARYGFVISTHCQPERATVARDIALLREVGGNLHVGHISRAETVGMIRAAKAEGLAITCEVTPHHLIGCDSDYKVNPPLRTKRDTLALIEGIVDGTIDCLATDHAPHTAADKATGAAGISNIEYAMQVFLKVFSENNIPLTRLSEMASLAPAKRLGRTAGLLQAGYPADITILSADEESFIHQEQMLSRSHNTPFDGWRVRGRVQTTIVGGETRYQYGSIG